VKSPLHIMSVIVLSTCFTQKCMSHFDQIREREICISQGSAAIFFKCGGQLHNHSRQMFTRFYLPKTIKIGSFLNELFNK